MPSLPTIENLARDLDSGRTTAQALVEACLAAIRAPEGDGAATFIAVDEAASLATAAALDAMRRAGTAPSRYAGIPIAVKDLFDIAGQVTRAGSTVLADAPPAARDAPAIARLRRMGFVLIGRTNMTEFAYSGIGTNPHYGTPRSPWRPDEARVPGGSSSGSAVAVARGMAHAGIGTDTGGSCRIPAAFTRIAGFKPTARRVPRDGAVPLSTSLDSIGPLARSVDCCAVIDAIMAGEPVLPLTVPALRGLRFCVPVNLVLDDLDPAVAAAFEQALERLARAGAALERIRVPAFDGVVEINARGGLTAAESYAWHRNLVEARAAGYDPRVISRIRRGATLSAADYIELGERRRAVIAQAETSLAPFDALLMPTAAILPPRIADLADDAAFTAANSLALRNPTMINMIDGCAVSLPIAAAEDAPVGLMVCGPANADRAILGIARAIEALEGLAPA